MSKPLFRIESLRVKGPGKEPAVVNFKPGVNFIIGPSNTGKSLIIDAIDYAFGYQPKGRNNHYRLGIATDNGYEELTLSLATEKGKVNLTRKFGGTKIRVDATDPDFESDTYSISNTAKKSINTILLQLLGIDEEHTVLSSQKGDANRVTWRSTQHFSLVRQANIASEPSIYINPDARQSSQTYSPALLLFLLTGLDFSATKGEDPKLTDAKKKAIIEYIRGYLEHLSKRREEISSKLPADAQDAHQVISSVEDDIVHLQNEINAAISESKGIMDRIYALNGKLSEYSTIRDRFSVLRTQYESDLGRLAFIVEGETARADVPTPHVCPFCKKAITDNETEISYMKDVRANLAHIKSHLSDLEVTDSDAAHHMQNIASKITELENKKAAVDNRIETELRPRLQGLKQQMAWYRASIGYQHELNLIDSEEISLKAELFEKENEETSPLPTFNILEHYTHEIIGPLESRLVSILEKINFPKYDATTFSTASFDLMFGTRPKSGYMGGGYCGIINTIMIIGLMEHLIDCGKHASGLAIVDSPLSQLSESKYLDQASTIRQGFIDFLLSHDSAGQIILVEQNEKMADVLDKLHAEDEKLQERVNIIEFTKDTEHQPYGFLPGVTN